MIAPSRCNNSSGGRTTVMSKECRIVNGGGSGYINHCEQELGDKNEVVMAAYKIADDQLKTSTAKCGYPSSSTDVVTLKEWTYDKINLIDKLKARVVHKDETIIQLSKEVDELKFKLNEANQQLAGITAKESQDVLPFTPVSSICSSVMGDLNSVELPELQDDKPKRRRNRQTTNKQVTLDTLDSNQKKRQRNRSSRTKSDDVGNMLELEMITTDNAYYTCLGNYDPIKDDPIPENSNNQLEIPSWRVNPISSGYSMEGTENMSDDAYKSRHSKLETSERKRKRWDIQRIRELKRVEYLKERRNKAHNGNDKEELTTLLPNPVNIKAIEITNHLPVSAFGCNLHCDQTFKTTKFFRSKYYNDGSNPPQKIIIRRLRSSCRNQLYDTA